MIDRASIMAWNEQAPWTEPAMVEQDLIICKALVCIFSVLQLALPDIVSASIFELVIQNRMGIPGHSEAF